MKLKKKQSELFGDGCRSYFPNKHSHRDSKIIAIGNKNPVNKITELMKYLLIYPLTLFFPMFPFDPPENIRKRKVF